MLTITLKNLNSNHGTAWGVDQPLYKLALGYGPWGIGSTRPRNRPDLPGPLDGPFSILRGSRKPFEIRQEVIDHLNKHSKLNIKRIPGTYTHTRTHARMTLGQY